MSSNKSQKTSMLGQYVRMLYK